MGNFSLSLEHGLKNAYSWMTGLTAVEPSWTNITVRLGKNDALVCFQKVWPNIQILHLRLLDGTPNGQRYETNSMESRKRLYEKEAKSTTATNGFGTYILSALKHIIATIMHNRKSNNIRVLTYKAKIPDNLSAGTDHADHVVSAKLTVRIKEKPQRYVQCGDETEEHQTDSWRLGLHGSLNRIKLIRCRFQVEGWCSVQIGCITMSIWYVSSPCIWSSLILE